MQNLECLIEPGVKNQARATHCMFSIEINQEINSHLILEDNVPDYLLNISIACNQ